MIELPTDVQALYAAVSALDADVHVALDRERESSARLEVARGAYDDAQRAYKSSKTDVAFTAVRTARDKFERVGLDHEAVVEERQSAEKARGKALTVAESAEAQWLTGRVSDRGWREELETAGLAEFLQCQKRSLEIINQLHDASNLTEERGRRLAQLTGKHVFTNDKAHLRYYLRRLVGTVWDAFDRNWRLNGVIGFYMDPEVCALLPSREYDADASQRATAKRLLGEAS